MAGYTKCFLQSFIFNHGVGGGKYHFFKVVVFSYFCFGKEIGTHFFFTNNK